MSRAIGALLLAVVMLCASCATGYSPGEPVRVLFVGNSLLYVGNVPAVYSALASANGHPVASDMIVRGGATLSERVADGSVERALDDHRYTALVLQERGGDLLCAFGPESCVDSRKAIATLSEMARERGVRVALLGSYQSLPNASLQLLEAEEAAAAEAGIPYLEVSEKLRRLRASAPELAWLHEDGAHPGKALALLDALLVYQALQGSLPDTKALTVDAPIYGSNSGLSSVLRAADAPPPLPGTPMQVSYPATTVERIVHALGE